MIAFSFLSEKSVSTLKLQRYSPVVSFGSFIILSLVHYLLVGLFFILEDTEMSYIMIHLELTFVCGVRQELKFSFTPYRQLLVAVLFVGRRPVFSLIELLRFLDPHINWLCKHGSFWTLSANLCVFHYQHHSVLITMALW